MKDINLKKYVVIVTLLAAVLVATGVYLLIKGLSENTQAPAINCEAVIQSKQDSLTRLSQQLQDCRKDLLRQDTIIMDQRSYIEQFEGLKKARPPNR